MTILSLDISFQKLNIALKKDDDVVFDTISDNYSHSSLLLPYIDKLMKKMNVKTLDKVLISIGPGSFTGLRVITSAAKGISSALSIPILCLSSLDVYRYSLERDLSDDEIILSLIDARKNRYYTAFYEKNGKIGNEEDLEIDEIKNRIKSLSKKVIIVAQDEILNIFKDLSDSCVFIDIEKQKNTALVLIDNIDKCNLLKKSEGPVYVRLSDAENALLEKNV